jgi:hypothetical protein
MATEGARPNDPALTKIVEDALDGTYGAYDAMREGLKQALGMKPAEPTREDFGYGPGTSGAAPSVAQIAAPAAAPTCIRVIYPGGNDRFEITGTSEAELDQKEFALRAMYPQR